MGGWLQGRLWKDSELHVGAPRVGAAPEAGLWFGGGRLGCFPAEGHFRAALARPRSSGNRGKWGLPPSGRGAGAAGARLGPRGRAVAAGAVMPPWALGMGGSRQGPERGLRVLGGVPCPLPSLWSAPLLV